MYGQSENLYSDEAVYSPPKSTTEFVTKDLYLAAAILALKYGKLESIDRSDKRHMKFYFTGAGMTEILSEWTNRTLQVNAAEYADGIRKMKSVIHSED